MLVPRINALIVVVGNNLWVLFIKKGYSLAENEVSTD
jgi:hypothetical protein